MYNAILFYEKNRVNLNFKHLAFVKSSYIKKSYELTFLKGTFNIALFYKIKIKGKCKEFFCATKRTWQCT